MSLRVSSADNGMEAEQANSRLEPTQGLQWGTGPAMGSPQPASPSPTLKKKSAKQPQDPQVRSVLPQMLCCTSQLGAATLCLRGLNELAVCRTEVLWSSSAAAPACSNILFACQPITPPAAILHCYYYIL